MNAKVNGDKPDALALQDAVFDQLAKDEKEGKARRRGAAADAAAAPKDELTIEGLRALALRQAAAWHENKDGLRDTSNLMDWRDNCRDEVRDMLDLPVFGSMEQIQLLDAWVNAFDGAVQGAHTRVGTRVDGFEAVSAINIEDTLSLAHQQAEAAGAIFRSIARMIDDRDITTLCQHGAILAEEFANDTDWLRERAVNAGFVGGPLGGDQ